MKSSVSLLHVLAPRIIETASDSYDDLYVNEEGRCWWCWEMNSDMVVAALSRHRAMSWKWEWDVGRENRLLESADRVVVVLFSLVVVISEVVVVVVDNSSGSSGEDGSSVRVAIDDSSSDCSIGIGLLLDSSSSVGVANDLTGDSTGT